MFQDGLDDLPVFDEADDPHGSPTLRTSQGIVSCLSGGLPRNPTNPPETYPRHTQHLVFKFPVQISLTHNCLPSILTVPKSEFLSNIKETEAPRKEKLIG